MIDIVIDTCTLVHANDSNSQYCDHSIEFINKMLGNQVYCVVDDGFSLDESINKSYIGFEYIKHLISGTLGFHLITHLATNNRINFVSKTIPSESKKYIEKKIRNKKDRHFLRVTCNAVEKTLASHDFTDYQVAKRIQIYKDLSINIVTAYEINPRM